MNTKEPINHNGIAIYHTTIKGIGERWAVQHGNKPGTGDTLHTTVEDARKEAELLSRRRECDARREATASAERAAAEEAKRARAADDIDGFVAGMDAMRSGRIRKALNKQMRFSEGVMTLRERVESLHKAGSLEATTFTESKIKPMSRAAFNRATQREQNAHEAKMKAAGNKTVYLVNGSDIGKTAYAYAIFLQDQDQDQAGVALSQHMHSLNTLADPEDRHPIPDFANARDADTWWRNRATSYPSQAAYRATPEYAEFVRKTAPLYARDKASASATMADAMQAAGVAPGDRVATTQTGAYLNAMTLTGTVVMRGGIPWVTLDEKIYTSRKGRVTDASRVRWSPAWQPIQAAEPTEPDPDPGPDPDPDPDPDPGPAPEPEPGDAAIPKKAGGTTGEKLAGPQAVTPRARLFQPPARMVVPCKPTRAARVKARMPGAPPADEIRATSRPKPWTGETSRRRQSRCYTMRRRKDLSLPPRRSMPLRTRRRCARRRHLQPRKARAEDAPH